MRRRVFAVLAIVALVVIFAAGTVRAHPAHWERVWIPPQGHWDYVKVSEGPWSGQRHCWIVDAPGYWDKRLVHEPHADIPLFVPLPFLGFVRGHHYDGPSRECRGPYPGHHQYRPH